MYSACKIYGCFIGRKDSEKEKTGISARQSNSIDSRFVGLGLCHLALGIAPRHIVQRFQVLDAFIAFNVMTRVCDPPHGLHPVGGIIIVQTLWFQKFAHGFCGLAGIVPGHFVKQMMDHVGTTNRVMKEIKNTVGSINRGKCSLDPGPFAFTVVWDGRIRVL